MKWLKLSLRRLVSLRSLIRTVAVWFVHPRMIIVVAGYKHRTEMLWFDFCHIREPWTSTKKTKWMISSSVAPSSRHAQTNVSSSSSTVNSHQSAALECVASSGSETAPWTTIPNSTTPNSTSSREDTKTSSQISRLDFLKMLISLFNVQSLLQL